MLENLGLDESSSENKLVSKISFIAYIPLLMMIAFYMTLIWGYFEYYNVILRKIESLPTEYPAIISFINVFVNDKELISNYIITIFSLLTLKLIPLIFLCLAISSVIKMIRLYKTVLIINESGVWFKSGIFSFTRTINGVVWHNADLASAPNGLIYHYFGNYPILLRNRYSGVIEINTPPLVLGKTALLLINKEVTERLNNPR